MKKFFQFSGTISGTTYFLRILFSIVLSIPAMIIIFAFFGIFAIEYAEIDMQNPEGFDQKSIWRKNWKQSGWFFRIVEDFIYTVLDYYNYSLINPCNMVWNGILL